MVDRVDFTAFSRDEFDAKQWLNSTFSALSGGDSAQLLVAKLQAVQTETAAELSSLSQEAAGAFPRLAAQTSQLRGELALLQAQLAAADAKPPADTPLLKLDRLRDHMTAAAAALKEADNWISLSADMDTLLEQGSLPELGERLIALSAGIAVLTPGSADAVQRSARLDTWLKVYERRAEPEISAATRAPNAEALGAFHQVYSALDCTNRLELLYLNAVKEECVSQWAEMSRDADTWSAACLGLFYDRLLAVWRAELDWCGAVFERPGRLVCHLLAAVLAALSPSLPNYVQTLTQRSLTNLGEVYSLTARLVHSLESSHTPGEEFPVLLRTIWKPLALPQRDLAACLMLHYQTHLNSVQLDASDTAQCLHLLNDSVDAVFCRARETVEEVTRLTDGCGFPALIGATQDFLVSYCSEIRRVAGNVRERLGDDQWADFQCALRLVELSGAVCDEMESLVGEFRASLEEARPLAPASPLAHAYSQQASTPPPAQPLAPVLAAAKTLAVVAQQLCLDVAMTPVKKLLGGMDSVNDLIAPPAELPDFALSPGEYALGVGSYLTALPQHLETFATPDNHKLLVATRFSGWTAESPEQVVPLWLEAVCAETLAAFHRALLRLSEGRTNTRQLAADTRYLLSVTEDLGLAEDEPLAQLALLLNMAELEGIEEDRFAADTLLLARRLRGLK